MRLIIFDRTVVVPLSLVVPVLAGFSAPTVAVQSIRVLVVVGAIGLGVFALTRWLRLRRVRRLAGMDELLQTAKDDASEVARMGSDAG
jgi:hypothetical protein